MASRAGVSPLGERFTDLVLKLQAEYCQRIESCDGGGRFGADRWQRPGGGGGLTRALTDGDLFERGGVNVSTVHGTLNERMVERLGGGVCDFRAAGLSVILHPRSPMVPTVHMNIRRIEKGDAAWFGGGADLGRSFLDAYLPIVARRRDEPWQESERDWQCLRRGRYVEFNLVYDRGTLFGLETGGRTESILISMPPEVHWRYAHEPAEGTREAELLAVLRQPREWVE